MKSSKNALTQTQVKLKFHEQRTTYEKMMDYSNYEIIVTSKRQPLENEN